MTAIRTRKPRPRPERKLRVISRRPNVETITVRVTVGDEVDYYDVQPGLVGGQPVWLVSKVDPVTLELRQDVPYWVDLGDFGESCTCKGCSYRGHCKHIDFLRVLSARGELPAVRCPVCGGSGHDGNLHDDHCPACSGDGIQLPCRCPECGGMGEGCEACRPEEPCEDF